MSTADAQLLAAAASRTDVLAATPIPVADRPTTNVFKSTYIGGLFENGAGYGTEASMGTGEARFYGTADVHGLLSSLSSASFAGSGALAASGAAFSVQAASSDARGGDFSQSAAGVTRLRALTPGGSVLLAAMDASGVEHSVFDASATGCSISGGVLFAPSSLQLALQSRGAGATLRGVTDGTMALDIHASTVTLDATGGAALRLPHASALQFRADDWTPSNTTTTTYASLAAGHSGALTFSMPSMSSETTRNALSVDYSGATVLGALQVLDPSTSAGGASVTFENSALTMRVGGTPQLAVGPSAATLGGALTFASTNAAALAAAPDGGLDIFSSVSSSSAQLHVDGTGAYVRDALRLGAGGAYIRGSAAGGASLSFLEDNELLLSSDGATLKHTLAVGGDAAIYGNASVAGAFQADTLVVNSIVTNTTSQSNSQSSGRYLLTDSAADFYWSGASTSAAIPTPNSSVQSGDVVLAVGATNGADTNAISIVPRDPLSGVGSGVRVSRASVLVSSQALVAPDIYASNSLAVMTEGVDSLSGAPTSGGLQLLSGSSTSSICTDRSEMLLAAAAPGFSSGDAPCVLTLSSATGARALSRAGSSSSANPPTFSVTDLSPITAGDAASLVVFPRAYGPSLNAACTSEDVALLASEERPLFLGPRRSAASANSAAAALGLRMDPAAGTAVLRAGAAARVTVSSSSSSATLYAGAGGALTVTNTGTALVGALTTSDEIRLLSSSSSSSTRLSQQSTVGVISQPFAGSSLAIRPDDVNNATPLDAATFARGAVQLSVRDAPNTQTTQLALDAAAAAITLSVGATGGGGGGAVAALSASGLALTGSLGVAGPTTFTGALTAFGSLGTVGTTTHTGTFTVYGAGLFAGGSLNVVGPTTLTGTLKAYGALTVGGTSTFSGAVAAANTMSVAGTASFAGPVTASSTLGVGGAAGFSGAVIAYGPLSVGGTTSFSGGVTASSTLDVGGAASFSGAVTAYGTLGVGGAASFSSPVTAASTLGVGGAASFSGPVTAASTLGVVGDASFSGALTAASTLNVGGASTFSGGVSALGTLGVVGTSSFSGALRAYGTLNVGGAAGFSGALTAYGSLGAAGPASFADTVAVGGASTFTGGITAFGSLGVAGGVTAASTLNVGGASTFTGGITAFGSLGVAGAASFSGGAKAYGSLSVAGTTSFSGGTFTAVPGPGVALSVSAAGATELTGALTMRGGGALSVYPASGGGWAGAYVQGFTGSTNTYTIMNNTDGPLRVGSSASGVPGAVVMAQGSYRTLYYQNGGNQYIHNDNTGGSTVFVNMSSDGTTIHNTLTLSTVSASFLQTTNICTSDGGATGRLTLCPSAGAGNWNPLVQAGDVAMVATAVDTSARNVTLTTWSDSAVGVRVTASGVTLAGPVSLSGALAVSGATTLGNSLAVSGATTLSNSLAVSGTVTAAGPVSLSNTLAVSGATTLGNTLAVGGAATLSGSLAVAGAVSATGAATLSGTLTVAGATTLSSSLSVGADLTVGGNLRSSSALITPQLITGYLINGGSSMEKAMMPVLGSMKLLNSGFADTDDAYVIAPGYRYECYDNQNYIGFLFEMDNTNGSTPAYFSNTNFANRTGSIRVYYLGTEVTYTNGYLN